ncbi:metallophosphoesterase family protein [Nakamurella lactea]|uniref:hypothetical protein n=1 Tax=Nakamurella lactea TaxID=459515 RepID=UPI000687EC58|nr:hypothetical protein [Nakamurella lactea]
MEYRLRDEGNWLLHGHTHSSEKVTSSREIHVGLDAWDLGPVEVGAVAKLMVGQLNRSEREAPDSDPEVPTSV